MSEEPKDFLAPDQLIVEAGKIAEHLKDLWDRSPLQKRILDFLSDYVIYIIRDETGKIIDFYAVGDSTELSAVATAYILEDSKTSVAKALRELLSNNLVAITFSDSPYARDGAVGVSPTKLWRTVERFAKKMGYFLDGICSFFSV